MTGEEELSVGGEYLPGDTVRSLDPGVSLRVVDVASGEPVEPGSSGRVVIPRAGVYRIEVRG